MNKIEQAMILLKEIKYKKDKISRIEALTLLAICRIKLDDSWSSTRREGVTVTKGIMDFITAEYGIVYAPNSRETVRRKVLHKFLNKGIIEYNPFNPALPTNSPKAHYAITDEFLKLVSSYETEEWDNSLKYYLNKIDKVKLNDREKKRVQLEIPSGNIYSLSPGKHNELQLDIISSFVSRYLTSCEVLYLGDTEKKDLIFNKEKCNELKIKIGKGTKLPDLVLYDEKEGIVYIIEAVTSHGHITEDRLKQLKDIFIATTMVKTFITAFDNFLMFEKCCDELARGTEVWISRKPTNRLMII